MTKTLQGSRITYTPKTAEHWQLSGVSHIGETGTYEVLGELTPSMTQDELVGKYGIEIPSTDLVWAIATRAYDLRNESPEEAEKLRAFLKQSFRQWPNTSTRIICAPEGQQDEVIHNYRTSESRSLRENIVGEDGWMGEISDKNVLETLLGTQDVSKINSVAQWINSTNDYIWRLNSKPIERDERVARFDADDYWLYLSCDWLPSGRYPAFRVVRVE